MSLLKVKELLTWMLYDCGRHILTRQKKCG